MALVYCYGGDASSFNDAITSAGWQPQNFAYGGRITFASAGTVDQLGVYVQNLTTATNIKIALYDSSGNLVVSASAALPSRSLAWLDLSVTESAVSAADYFILYSSQGDQAGYGYDTANDGSFATRTYASFPADPETISAEGEANLGYGGRANFTAGAGGATGRGRLVGGKLVGGNLVGVH